MPPTNGEALDTTLSATDSIVERDINVEAAKDVSVTVRDVEEVDVEGENKGLVVNGDTCRVEARPVDEHIPDPHITALPCVEIDESEVEREVRFVLGQLISQLLRAHDDEDDSIIEYVKTSNGHNSDQDADEEEPHISIEVQSELPLPISTSQSPPPLASADSSSTAPLTVDTSSSTPAVVVVDDKKMTAEEEDEEEQPITPPLMGASVPLSPTSATSAGGGKIGNTLFVPTEVCYNYHCY